MNTEYKSDTDHIWVDKRYQILFHIPTLESRLERCSNVLMQVKHHVSWQISRRSRLLKPSGPAMVSTMRQRCMRRGLGWPWVCRAPKWPRALQKCGVAASSGSVAARSHRCEGLNFDTTLILKNPSFNVCKHICENIHFVETRW